MNTRRRSRCPPDGISGAPATIVTSRKSSRADTLLQPLGGTVRHLDRDPAARRQKTADAAEHDARLGNVFEHVGQRDGVVSYLDVERVDVALMHRRACGGGGVRAGLGVELESFGIPARTAGGRDEPSGVGPHIKQSPPPAWQPCSEAGEHIREDIVLVRPVVLGAHPLVRPTLVVHPVEVVHEGGQRGGLREPARGAADDRDRRAGIFRERRVLRRVLVQIEGRVVDA